MRTPDLTGKVAIVTGGGRGIGRSMAIALAKAGACVTITVSRNPSELRDTVKEIATMTNDERVHGLIADVTDENACARTVNDTLERFGGVHILVNNAARGHREIYEANPGQPKHFWKSDTKAWRSIIETNVNGPFNISKLTVPLLLAQNYGRIVNISVTERSMVRAQNTPYGPSKAALESMTCIWAKELQATDKNVTCNSLSPGGATRTGMIYGSRRRMSLRDPDIMGPPVVWIASEQSNGITGRRVIATEDVSSDSPGDGLPWVIAPSSSIFSSDSNE